MGTIQKYVRKGIVYTYVHSTTPYNIHVYMCAHIYNMHMRISQLWLHMYSYSTKKRDFTYEMELVFSFTYRHLFIYRFASFSGRFFIQILWFISVPYWWVLRFSQTYDIINAAITPFTLKSDSLNSDADTPFTYFVSFSKLFKISVPQFPDL